MGKKKETKKEKKKKFKEEKEKKLKEKEEKDKKLKEEKDKEFCHALEHSEKSKLKTLVRFKSYVLIKLYKKLQRIRREK